MTLTRTILVASLALGLPAGAVLAQDLPSPSGPVVLTVSGAIPTTNAGDTAQFDSAMLQALDATAFTTSTPWTDGSQSFTGVSLRVLLDRLGVDALTLSATAINDYAIDIPVSDAVEGGPIIAYLRNEAPMSVRDKGPLWIVYPYDTTEAYQAEVVYSRSIWQLDRIVVSD